MTIEFRILWIMFCCWVAYDVLATMIAVPRQWIAIDTIIQNFRDDIAVAAFIGCAWLFSIIRKAECRI